MSYRVLTEFEQLFAGRLYRHRDSSRGNFVATHLYEDLVTLNRSLKLVRRVVDRERVLNTANLAQGIQARRGDGTFGETVPGTMVVADPGYTVARGRVATIEIGVEVKVLAKAMIKQIDRVIGDLQKQVAAIRRGGTDAICVALVGVSHAPYAVGYEGDRAYRTDGKANRHPIQEAAEVERRLLANVREHYDEFVLLRYAATNESPFPFAWIDYQTTFHDYGAALVRIGRSYDQRFP
jgi:hypothetical protein